MPVVRPGFGFVLLDSLEEPQSSFVFFDRFFRVERFAADAASIRVPAGIGSHLDSRYTRKDQRCDSEVTS